MAPHTNDQRLELLQGTLDMLILPTLQSGPRHGHGIGETIRVQPEDLLKVQTKATKGILRPDPRTVPRLRLHDSRRTNSIRLRVTSTWSNRNLKLGAIMTIPLLALFTCVLSTPLAGQWLKQPTAGIPRNADGKPNLTAPAPRAADGHPDLSGLWRSNWNGIFDVTSGLKPGDIVPWAQALVKQRREDLAKDYMGVLCLPAGPAFPASLMEAKIIQTPSLVAVLHPDLTYRQIFMDGRALESDPNPAWMGYSVGRWENDTLVVESAGFNDRTWLDRAGHPHTEGLRTTERYRRLNFGRMEVLLTYEDPAVYAKPLTLKIDMSLAADTEMLEYVCNENEKDRAHMIGKASDYQKYAVELSPETLSKYAGAYQMGAQRIAISLEQGQLKLSFSSTMVASLIPLSATRFFYSSPIEGELNFQRGTDGAITGFTMGGQTAVRRKE